MCYLYVLYCDLHMYIKYIRTYRYPKHVYIYAMSTLYNSQGSCLPVVCIIFDYMTVTILNYYSMSARV